LFARWRAQGQSAFGKFGWLRFFRERSDGDYLTCNQCLPQCPNDDCLNFGFFAETNFNLCWMDIDIDKFGWHVQKKHDNWLATFRDEAVISVAHGCGEGFVADEPVVDEKPLMASRGFAHRRWRNEAANGVWRFVVVDGNKLLGDFATENLRKRRAFVSSRDMAQNFSVAVKEGEGNFGESKDVTADDFSDVGKLC
jgi:hypothetical protein